MHGQKRSEYKSRLLNPETSSKLATKAQQWNHLSHELLTQRRRLFGTSSPGAPTGAGTADGEDGGIDRSPSPKILLSLTEKMLSVNPDPSHLWNIRREMLLFVPPLTTANDNTAPGDAHPSKEPPFELPAELALTAHCLQRNPKSYSAWYHRKWSVAYSLTHPGSNDESDASKQHLTNMKTTLKAELELCAQFLQLDERNFHCWNYRRFVVALLGSCGRTVEKDVGIGETPNILDMDLFDGSWSSWLNQSKVMMGAQLSKSAGAAMGAISMNSEEEGGEASCVAKAIIPLSKQELEEIITNEWDFTSAKIQDNFSNGSAFHYRSKLLPLLLSSQLSSDSNSSEGNHKSDNVNERYDAILALAREEWESILLNAIFTEPDDQTPWWYHRFIVSWAKPSDDLEDGMFEEYESLLYEMADSLRDLLEVERESGMVGEEDTDGKKDESKGAKCKWAYIGLHLVLSTLLESKSMDAHEAENLREEAEECLTELMKIDSNRGERYHILTAVLKGS